MAKICVRIAFNLYLLVSQKFFSKKKKETCTLQYGPPCPNIQDFTNTQQHYIQIPCTTCHPDLKISIMCRSLDHISPKTDNEYGMNKQKFTYTPTKGIVFTTQIKKKNK